VYRVGHGYDVHRLAPGRKLRIGGVAIESHLGPVSHSDGDVLLHAVTNALLGAIGEGDIGLHFPDTDERFRGMESARFVAEAMVRVRRTGKAVVNLDATVLAEAPRLAPQRGAIQARIAELLGVGPTAVNVKFATGEGLGPVGEREAIEAYAVVLLGPAS
jgi:2-C-methyl-D-erythritol 2,4-cyclodiphosphate synthase